MMDYSDLDQNLIISTNDEDVENPTDRSPLHAKNKNNPPKKHMDSSNSTSMMSSIFRTIPLLIKHTAPPSRSRCGVDYDYSTIESDSHRQTGEDGDKKSSKVVEFDDEKERERLTDIMQAGLKHLLSNVHDRQTLFGLGLKMRLDYFWTTQGFGNTVAQLY
ncbi:hypothetical protein SOVF_128320 [Spinacia oleracea]|nr:hypothetical protein SOVF_128320 [Spinacia oleracea]